MPLMSIRGYAQHCGVTEAAVQRAIRQGWLKQSGGRINSQTADRAWARYLARPAKYRFPERPSTPMSLEQVRERLAAKAEVICERMLAVPLRLGDVVAAETDVAKIRGLLEKECQEALIDLADVLEP